MWYDNFSRCKHRAGVDNYEKIVGRQAVSVMLGYRAHRQLTV